MSLLFDRNLSFLKRLHVLQKPNPYKDLSSFLEEKRKHNETANNSVDPCTSVYESIETDMTSYEQTGKRPYALEQLYSALCSIPPTSAEVTLHC